MCVEGEAEPRGSSARRERLSDLRSKGIKRTSTASNITDKVVFDRICFESRFNKDVRYSPRLHHDEPIRMRMVLLLIYKMDCDDWLKIIAGSLQSLLR